MSASNQTLLTEPALRLELATEGDLSAVAALMNIAFRGTGAQASWTSEAAYIDGERTSEALLREERLAKPEGVLLLVRASSAAPLQGSVWLEPLGEDVWYLGSLTVDPRLQNNGAGRRLLEAAEVWVYGRGGRTIRMTVVNVRDALIAWYVRRGYQLTGEVTPFPYEEPRFGVPRRPDLAFVTLEKALPAASGHSDEGGGDCTTLPGHAA